MSDFDQPLGEEPQVDERPRVTVYVKPSGKGLPVCQGCKTTLRKLDEAGIQHNKIIVHDDHRELIDELKREATSLGVACEMPFVHVYYPATTDETTWFGFQPDKINDLKKELQP
ncbi:hypothetical protein ACR9WD_05875 [Glutamicibacter sp. PAEs-4]|uniref:hypothetical protein n=1 Tax=Glutamicibacter sp. PAEs-4 TaxID=3444114 RepID=UPI003EB925C3